MNTKERAIKMLGFPKPTETQESIMEAMDKHFEQVGGKLRSRQVGALIYAIADIIDEERSQIDEELEYLERKVR
jgi:hypothetical protein